MKKIAIVLSVVVLALIVGGAFVVSNRKSPTFTLEPKPRAVLEAAQLNDTRRPVVTVTAAALLDWNSGKPAQQTAQEILW